MSKKMAAAFAILLVSGCVDTEILAPGAERIALTNRPTDVERCRPVGSLQIADRSDSLSFPIVDEVTELRNQALGLGTGADTVLVTSSAFAAHATGVAYRCHEAPAEATP